MATVAQLYIKNETGFFILYRVWESYGIVLLRLILIQL